VALNFPDSPTVGDIYTDNTSGFSYEWDGVVWKSYIPSTTNNIKIIDNISGLFNGSTQTFSLTSNSVAVTPANSQQVRVVLGGIVQSPAVDYTISGSNITFITPPENGLSFSGVSLGPAVPINTVNDGAITPQKLSTGGPTWNSGGGFNVTGITTLNNKVKVGVGTTALIVEGDARITGILTVGTSSITLNGISDSINVGAAVTISTSNIKIGGLTISNTGIAGSGSTVTSASVAYGLQGNPTISVSGVNNSGVSTSIDTRILSISEKTTVINGNTVNLVYNTGGGNIAICTNPSGSVTLNVTGIPTDSSFDNNSVSFSVVTQNTGTVRSCTAITLNGVSKTIKWYGGSLSEAIVGVTTTNGFDIYSFVGLNTVGSASTTDNYIILGSVNGGYR
jgi:hypothetical protein